MTIFFCIDELVPHFGPGKLLVTRAVDLMRRGHRVAVFVERPVADDNQYAAALRAANVALHTPGAWAAAVDHWSRLDHLLLALLLPLRLPLALADMALHRRTWQRAWAGVAGRLNRLLPRTQLGAPLRRALFTALDREQRRSKADLANMMTGNGSAFAWAASRSVPIVYTENIVPNPSFGVAWWDDVRRHIGEVDLTLTLCLAAEPAIRDYLGYRGPIALVPSNVADPLGNGADTVARDAPRDVVVIGSAARLSAVKGFDILLRALRSTLDRTGDPPLRLWIAGDGPERAALEALAGELQLSEHVRFLGHCDSAAMARFWAAIDIFVLASHWEGMPLAILEAMAHGRPVIATAVDGVPEAVRDGETGLLVPPGAVEPLADALHRLLHSGAQRAALGAGGRRRFVETYRTEVVVDQLLDAYRRVLDHVA